MTLLKVEKLCKYFPVRSGFFRRTVGWVKALHEATFTLAKGEVLGIVGESGSGKTTLAKTILRLIDPTAGSILFQDIDLVTIGRKEMKAMRKKIQVVVQNPSLSLNPRKTIYETLAEVLCFHEIVKNMNDMDDHIETLLSQVGLHASSMTRYPHELSSGQQQRVSIARALSVEPELIVLDECVSALDISVQAQVLNLLQELQKMKGLSYLFISHDLGVVEHLSDRILVMYEGQIVEQGATDELLAHPKHPYTQRLLNAALADQPSARKIK